MLKIIRFAELCWLFRPRNKRHAYAQGRYEELTGWKPPARGGRATNTLSPEQRALDRQARLAISHELGHERLAIVSVYVG